MENTHIIHSDSVGFELFMGKKLKKKKPHASLDFSKKSDEKQFFFEWPNEKLKKHVIDL